MALVRRKKGTVRHKKLSKEVLTEQVRSSIRFDRTWSDAMADWLTSFFGTATFLIANVVFFAVWIVLNTPWFGFEPFDPFPFGLLTMAVSLEAIVLAVIILISQNRQGKIAEIRQKMDFEIDVRAEEENSKILEILQEMRAHVVGKLKKDDELARMTRVTDIERMREALEAEDDTKTN